MALGPVGLVDKCMLAGLCLEDTLVSLGCQHCGHASWDLVTTAGDLLEVTEDKARTDRRNSDDLQHHSTAQCINCYQMINSLMVRQFINYVAVIPSQMPNVNQVVSGRDTKTRLISISEHAKLTIRDGKLICIR